MRDLLISNAQLVSPRQKNLKCEQLQINQEAREPQPYAIASSFIETMKNNSDCNLKTRVVNQNIPVIVVSEGNIGIADIAAAIKQDNARISSEGAEGLIEIIPSEISNKTKMKDQNSGYISERRLNINDVDSNVHDTGFHVSRKLVLSKEIKRQLINLRYDDGGEEGIYKAFYILEPKTIMVHE